MYYRYTQIFKVCLISLQHSPIYLLLLPDIDNAKGGNLSDKGGNHVLNDGFTVTRIVLFKSSQISMCHLLLYQYKDFHSIIYNNFTSHILLFTFCQNMKI